jgi:hypothetical protein
MGRISVPLCSSRGSFSTGLGGLSIARRISFAILEAFFLIEGFFAF